MFVILRFIVVYKSTAKSSIIFGRRKIDNPSIHGKWTKPISYILTFIIAFIITLVYEQRRELKAEKNIRPVEDGTRTSGNG